MQNKKIFMTGGTGFLGHSLIRHYDRLIDNEIVFLSHSGARPHIDQAPLFEHNNVSFIDGDVRDFDLRDDDFDYIVHAATPSCRPVDDDELQSIIVDGTRHVLDFAARNKGLAKFLFISSGAVYGTRYQSPVNERQACDPVTVYGKAKHTAESLCEAANVPCTTARLFAFVGEDLPLDVHFAIGNFIGNCLRHQDIVIQGDGTPVRTYMHSFDLAHWVMALLSEGRAGEAYNVGSNEEVSIAELARTVHRLGGSENQVAVQSPPGAQSRSYYVPDTSKITQELGLKMTFDLNAAILETLKFHQTK